ncbi:MAG: hypothetical protein WD076_05725, partial [Parvularculaceae bacterium]
MRLLLFIMLMISMAVAPAAALATCASMGSGAAMAEMSPTPAHDQKNMAGMAGHDCDETDGKARQTHDAGCVAACALVCPGFYCGPDQSSVQSFA